MVKGEYLLADCMAIFANQRASLAESAEEERLRVKDPFAVGRWVTIQKLHKDISLNGGVGMIIKAANENNRLGIRILGAGDKLVNIENSVPFADDELVKLARYGARGERSKATQGVQTWCWPTCILQHLPMEVSPVSQLIGFPLCVARVKPPLDKFIDRADFDNQFVTYLMIDPYTGFAAPEWDSFVGPAVVWRSSGLPFSADDAFLVHDYLCTLMEKYGSGHVKIRRDITPAAFLRSKRRSLEYERMNTQDDQRSKDINI